jgi:hypothetical protein
MVFRVSAVALGVGAPMCGSGLVFVYKNLDAIQSKNSTIQEHKSYIVRFEDNQIDQPLGDEAFGRISS